MLKMRRAAVAWAAVLSLVAAAAAAPPTATESIVVTLPGGSSTTSATPQETTTAENKESTSAKPLAPIEIYSMHVISEVSSRYSHTVVSSRVANPGDKAQEVTFSVLLPETAFISGFVMEIDGKTYVAYVKEKEDAKKIYQEAVDSGATAAHVTAKARDSNHFTVAVNLEGNSKATFNLTYEELLSRKLGLYNDIINLNPGKIVKELSVVVHIKENRPITILRVPELKSGNEIDADEKYKVNEIAVIKQSEDKKEATITFSPTADEQIQLRDIFREKLVAEKERNRRRHDNYYGVWDDEDKKNTSKETDGLMGQFVVQYDVERDPHNGEVLVYDGYFVHFFAPSDLKPLNKHVVFVLDISGSMIGRKIVQLKEAMLSILDDLNPGDYLSLIEFSYNSKVYDLDNSSANAVYGSHSYYGYDDPPLPTVVGPPPAPSPVTPDYINKAKEVIRNLDATGGTNINDALTTALKVVNAGVHRKPKADGSEDSSSSNNSSSLEPTTKLIAASDSKKSSKEEVQQETASTDKIVDPEPIIIFLTDGDATVGETRSDRILTTIMELNSGKRRAAIFSLAFGEDADRGFLKKLALRNDGFLRHIYEAADAHQQLKYFYKQVSSPLLAGINFTYPADQVEEDSVTKKKFHTLFSGGEIVVAGKMRNRDAYEITPTVSANSFLGPVDFIPKTPIDYIPKALNPQLVKTQFEPTERLWAYLRIKQLLDEKDSEIEESKRPSWYVSMDEPPTTEKSTTVKPVKHEDTPEEKALEIALKYSFVTPLTSLVVVKPNATTSAVNAESVDKSINDGAYPQAFIGGALPLAVNPVNIVEEEDEEEEEEELQDSEIESLAFAMMNPLAKYNLDDYTWLSQYFIEGPPARLELPINGTVVVLNLENNQEKLPSDNPSCNNSVTGVKGVCKYITTCNLAKQALSDLKTYTKYYCSCHGYAGICCPEKS